MRSTIDVQADLDAAYASRRAALQAQSYTVGDGAIQRSATRATLQSINDTIAALQAELAAAQAAEGAAAAPRRILYVRAR
jgi:hypothetical protein